MIRIRSVANSEELNKLMGDFLPLDRTRHHTLHNLLLKNEVNHNRRDNGYSHRTHRETVIGPEAVGEQGQAERERLQRL